MDEIYAAIAQLAQLLTETGTTGDGVAVASLFGRLANLGLTSDAASSNGNALQRLANLVAVLGQTADVASPTGTALARLADLENKIGAINPASGGTDTLFHYLYNAILGLGAQGDAASATGSANAKLAYLIANGQKARGLASARGSFSTSLQTLQTALNISGKGKLLGITLVQTAAAADTTTIKITIDGFVLIWGKSDATNADQFILYANPYTQAQDGTQTVFGAGLSYTQEPNSVECCFKQSLKIEILTSIGTNTGTVKWLYEVE